ncbi:MAG: hypothetical protein M3Q19_10080 [Pseudomonadota bacterium]|nr:hypothetical protein [Pseudomonadota bacterium]
MAQKLFAVALSLIAVASPIPAAQPDLPPTTGAPAAGPDAKYCMKVDPLTGSNIERTRCWTREKWAEQGVDVDKEWAKEGVRVIG